MNPTPIDIDTIRKYADRLRRGRIGVTRNKAGEIIGIAASHPTEANFQIGVQVFCPSEWSRPVVWEVFQGIPFWSEGAENLGPYTSEVLTPEAFEALVA